MSNFKVASRARGAERALCRSLFNGCRPNRVKHGRHARCAR